MSATRGGRASATKLVVGVDTGGTFTDIVVRDGRKTITLKVPSTPDDPARAVLDGLAELLEGRRADLMTYGTTVATNAVLERKGARTALITTEGFEDIVEIGRQARPELYALEPVKTPPLVPASLRIGFDERMLYDGKPQRRPTRRGLAGLRRALKAKRVSSVAVCLLHAHTNGRHEREIARALSVLDIPVTLSHRLSPTAGEFERTSTAVANAYVGPLIDGHIERLARASGARTLRVMQSTGGAIGAQTARREPVRTMLSGPAGGVAAALACAINIKGVSKQGVVTLDMGGTSTDVSYIHGQLPRRNITEIGGLPLSTPCLDIHTIGAGGGSLATIDEGGALRVGPKSAGARPGPACYGSGTGATVTDANLVLGRLRPDAFLGGSMTLQPERSVRALDGLARRMGARSAQEAAQGVVDVVEANMERAIRLITVERGQDPRGATLVAFGGAGSLHACQVAASLGIGSVLIPPAPGLLSARGVLGAPVMHDISVALNMARPDYDGLAAKARTLAARAAKAATRDAAGHGKVTVRSSVRLRYQGQSLELEVPLLRSFRRLFDQRHKQLFHHSDPLRPIEACAINVTASVPGPLPTARSRPSVRTTAARRATADTRVAVFDDGRHRRCPVYHRDRLGPGNILKGPAIVTEYSSTLWLAAGWKARVTGDGALLMETGDGR